MAVTCDNCGKIIGEDEFVSFATDHTENKVGGCSADDWFYFHVGECASTARGILESLRHFSHEGEASGLRWMLVETDAAPAPPKAAPEPAASPADTTQHAPAKVDRERNWWTKLAYILDEPRAPKALEIAERREGGICLTKVISRPATRRALLDNNLVTLEDVVGLTEVEFLGLRQIGGKVTELIKAALVRHTLAFREGPNALQLAQTLRELRRENGYDRPEDLSDALAAELGIEETVPDEDVGMRNTPAYRELRGAIHASEGRHKPPSPAVFELLAHRYGMEVADILDRAKDSVVIA